MIDPLLPSAAERLAALRKPAETKRQKPAHTSKILTAGISTTTMLGLVAAMGWPTGTSVAQSAEPAAPIALAVAPVVLTIPAAATPVIAAPVAVVDPAVVAAPVATQPAPLPVVAAPIVIPVAVPVAQPSVQTNAPRAASNTTTKSSG